ncbi:YwqG family protein [Acinetobacter courvalinii]|uniref:YwqG family protein n=1 Tax=Acinetobacter courvalinii TaxID=280147 RepID=A0AA42I9L4_9GAMM|nr:YwqG family protein [Acinetobacter courvalinii]MDH0564856.1 YwqG family protein [Acinetobacter courvalinii]
MNLQAEHLPHTLHPYLEKISATILPTVTMQLTASDNLSLWQSKIGGEPYLPLDTAYPVDSNGNPLALLAQFNFAEIPSLPNFPDQGILQFYIAADDLYGMNFDDQQQQSGFKVLYFEQVIADAAQLKQDFSELEFDEDAYLPFTGQYSIEFNLTSQPISLGDFAFAPKILGVEELYDFEDRFEGGDFEDDFIEPYDEVASASGHRLGGYPYFTQTDPRHYNDKVQDYILLFQLDTDDAENEIMWGDSGVGNFFIHPEDLKNRDFSKVLYNWDCC